MKFSITALLLVLIAQQTTAQVCGWTLLNQTGSPGGPRDPKLIYDDSESRVILFGGGGGSTGTWAWDGSSWTLIPTQTEPVDRVYHTMAAQPGDSTQKILLYGGTSSQVQYLSDTWSFDGNEWTQHLVIGPPSSYGGALVFHDAIGSFVHFGGFSPPPLQQFRDDTYEWDGSNWSAVFAPGPSPRVYPMMAYDPIRQEAVLFGGLAPPGLTHLADTWVYDSTGWTQKSVASPPGLYRGAMAFDSSRGTIVMHGGFLQNGIESDQTWEWDGFSWTQVAQINLIGRTNRSMVYDAANAQLIFCGGNTPEVRWMDWSSGPSILPVTGSATAEYPCPLSIGISANGSGTLNYQWHKNGVPIFDGGPISGTATATLTISPTGAADAGSYFCRVTDSCATADSGTIVVNSRCIADVNGNGTAEPTDFTAWIIAFNNNDSAADQNCDLTVTPTDFTAWIANFNAGC
jgi:hypothetical protein